MIDSGLLSSPALMPDASPAGAERRDVGFPDLALPDLALGRNAILVTVPLARPLSNRQLTVTRGGRPVKGPVVATVVEAAEGGHMALIALPAAADATQALMVTGPDGEILLDRPGEHSGTAQPLGAELPARLAPADRHRMLRSLLESAGLFLRLYDDLDFTAAARALLAAAAPLTAGAPIRFGGRFLLLPLKPGAATVESVLLVGAGAIRRNPFRPVAWTGKGGRSCALLVELPDRLAGARFDLLAFTPDRAQRLAVDPAAARPTADLDAVLAGDPSRTLAAYLFGAAAPYLANDAMLAAQIRQRLPAAARAEHHAPIDARRPLGARLELAVQAPDGGLFLRGWLFDPLGVVEGWTAVSAFGERRPAEPPRHRLPRPDLAEAAARHPFGAEVRNSGFVLHIPGPRPALPGIPWHLELSLADGGSLDLVPPPPPERPDAARALVLSGIPPQHLTAAMIGEALAPAAQSFQRACLEGPRVWAEHRFGPAAEDPEVSVVIPLYRTLDYLRHQFIAFFADPDLRGAELVLVLDSPEQEEYLLDLLRGLDLLHGLSVRLIVHGRNLGYAAAVNSGAGAARGRRLMLLNSDVLPARPGWLSAMGRALNRNPGTGAVGPKLLFEDDSIQHAGLFFWRDPRGDWRNRHFHKGYAADYGPANRSRAVPGVTGACILVERRLFEAVGGISEDYVIGDFEDSDFCLKLRERGLRCWYEASVELYHFERRSILRHDGYTRTAACEVNRWLHEQRWGAAMAAAMAEAAAGPVPGDTTRERIPT
ncbi:glycosyltransferase [Azospirillum sp. SYSU D00513]|uniref:glycosyltransferase n=1 Tax=Azospirillum sp. SYSU D00513 TaxID=2812561 RepID=UPI001A95E179|nr:glycosyltransferase [Azospirillum sp. SYSU D00513]